MLDFKEHVADRGAFTSYQTWTKLVVTTIKRGSSRTGCRSEAITVCRDPVEVTQQTSSISFPANP